jgi:hypothetical protein
VNLAHIVVVVGTLSSGGVASLMVHEIGSTLGDYHPEEWLKVSKSITLQSAVSRFALSGRHRELGDADLTLQVMLYHAALVGLLLAIVFAVFAAAS